MSHIICQQCGKKANRYPTARFCFSCVEQRGSSRSEKWRKENPQAVRAMLAVSEAIFRGQLPMIKNKTKCVDCGETATVYDHRDYAKPLEVEPVCGSCNKNRGPGLNGKIKLMKNS